MKVFTTFTGIGSPEMALRNLGIDFELVGMSEVDRYALLAYDAIHNEQENIDVPSKEEMLKEFETKNIAYNFSTGKSEIPRNIKDIEKLYIAHKRNKNYGDITRIDEKELPDFDLFTYSFPCKDISLTGNRKGFTEGTDSKSSLLWECERIITEKLPNYLMLENVGNLVGSQNIKNFKRWINILNTLGYRSVYKVLNAKDYGLPQNRERVIMISIKKTVKDYDRFMMPSPYDNLPSIQYFLEGSDIDKSIPISVDNSIRGGVHSAISLELTAIDKSTKNMYQAECTAGWHRHCIGLKISQTICAADYAHAFLDSNNTIRKLSSLECWKLMGFKEEDYSKAKNLAKLPESKLHERAGRGIAVNMLEAVFDSLFNKKGRPKTLFGA